MLLTCDAGWTQRRVPNPARLFSPLSVPPRPARTFSSSSSVCGTSRCGHRETREPTPSERHASACRCRPAPCRGQHLDLNKARRHLRVMAARSCPALSRTHDRRNRPRSPPQPRAHRSSRRRTPPCGVGPGGPFVTALGDRQALAVALDHRVHPGLGGVAQQARLFTRLAQRQHLPVQVGIAIGGSRPSRWRGTKCRPDRTRRPDACRPPGPGAATSARPSA